MPDGQAAERGCWQSFQVLQVNIMMRHWSWPKAGSHKLGTACACLPANSSVAKAENQSMSR